MEEEEGEEEEEEEEESQDKEMGSDLKEKLKGIPSLKRAPSTEPFQRSLGASGPPS